MKSEKRIVIIHTPQMHIIYTTSQEVHEGDRMNYQLAISIIFEGPDVTVTYEEDGGTVTKMYYGMPYEIEMF